MRITKTFKIEGYDKSFEVKELKVKEIIGLMAGDESVLDDLSIEKFKELATDKFLPIASNIEFNELEEMTPSELIEVWDHFKEVNKSFFDLAQKMGLQEMIDRIKEAIIVDFGRTVAPL
jgi:hypothetical protein